MEGRPFKLDYRYEKEIADQAPQVSKLPKERLDQLKTWMQGDQNEDYYHGLMAGFAGAYALLQQLPLDRFVTFMPQILVFVAHQIKTMEQKE